MDVRSFEKVFDEYSFCTQAMRRAIALVSQHLASTAGLVLFYLGRTVGEVRENQT
jgi:hypothetical protein